MMSLIGAFYYIRIVKTMYFDAPEGCSDEVVMAADAKAVLGLNGFSVVVVGLLPAPLMALCFDVIQRSLAG